MLLGNGAKIFTQDKIKTSLHQFLVIESGCVRVWCVCMRVCEGEKKTEIRREKVENRLKTAGFLGSESVENISFQKKAHVKLLFPWSFVSIKQELWANCYSV